MEMLKRLQEEKVVVELDEEDEVLIKSITFRNSKDYVKRIKKVDDDDEDFAIPGQSSVTSKVLGEVCAPEGIQPTHRGAANRRHGHVRHSQGVQVSTDLLHERHSSCTPSSVASP